MTFRDALRRRAGSLGGRLVLAEGWDPRIQEAARLLEAEEIAVVRTLPRSVRDDPQTERVAELLASRKPDKVRDAEHARTLASDPLRFAAGLVALGEADAAVAGATCPTAEVLRAALWGIGPAEGIQTVSSSFYMAFDDSPLTERASPGEPGAAGGAPGLVLTFTDSAVVPDPDAVQLADIALAAAGDRRLIVGDEPIVAFLSYSSKGSAEGLSVEKVRQAVVRFRELAASIPCDGELQGDAALVPSIGERKAAGSPVAGRANVLVFPDLDSGNIAYKLVQRLAGARATGPIVQGLALPMADLSRGATVADVVDVASAALLQAAGRVTGSRAEDV